MSRSSSSANRTRQAPFRFPTPPPAEPLAAQIQDHDAKEKVYLPSDINYVDEARALELFDAGKLDTVPPDGEIEQFHMIDQPSFYNIPVPQYPGPTPYFTPRPEFRANAVCDPAISTDVTVHLVLPVHVDLDEDVGELSRLTRLGNFAGAEALFDARLSPFISTHAVVATRYFQMVNDQGNYGFARHRDLSFLHDALSSGPDDFPVAAWEYFQSAQLRPFVVYKLSAIYGMELPWPSSQIQRQLMHYLLHTRSRNWHWPGDGLYHEGPLDLIQYLYQSLLKEGRVWDLKDVLLSCLREWKMADILDAISTESPHAGSIERRAPPTRTRYDMKPLEALVQDWTAAGSDEPTLLALLEVLACVIIFDPLFGRELRHKPLPILSHAQLLGQGIVTTLAKDSPQCLRTRPYIRWLLAKAIMDSTTSSPDLFCDERLRRESDGLFLHGEKGVSPDFVPLYMPKMHELPSWPMSTVSKSIRDSVTMARKLASSLNDYESEAMCRGFLVRISDEPLRELCELATFQRDVQCDNRGYFRSVLSKYLFAVLPQDHTSLHQELLSLEPMFVRSDGDNVCKISPDLTAVWAMVLRALSSTKKPIGAASPNILPVFSDIPAHVRPAADLALFRNEHHGDSDDDSYSDIITSSDASDSGSEQEIRPLSPLPVRASRIQGTIEPPRQSPATTSDNRLIPWRDGRQLIWQHLTHEQRIEAARGMGLSGTLLNSPRSRGVQRSASRSRRPLRRDIRHISTTQGSGKSELSGGRGRACPVQRSYQYTAPTQRSLTTDTLTHWPTAGASYSGYTSRFREPKNVRFVSPYSGSNSQDGFAPPIQPYESAYSPSQYSRQHREREPSDRSPRLPREVVHRPLAVSQDRDGRKGKVLEEQSRIGDEERQRLKSQERYDTDQGDFHNENIRNRTFGIRTDDTHDPTTAYGRSGREYQIGQDSMGRKQEDERQILDNEIKSLLGRRKQLEEKEQLAAMSRHPPRSSLAMQVLGQREDSRPGGKPRLSVVRGLHDREKEVRRSEDKHGEWPEDEGDYKDNPGAELRKHQLYTKSHAPSADAGSLPTWMPHSMSDCQELPSGVSDGVGTRGAKSIVVADGTERSHSVYQPPGYESANESISSGVGPDVRDEGEDGTGKKKERGMTVEGCILHPSTWDLKVRDVERWRAGEEQLWGVRDAEGGRGGGGEEQLNRGQDRKTGGDNLHDDAWWESAAAVGWRRKSDEEEKAAAAVGWPRKGDEEEEVGEDEWGFPAPKRKPTIEDIPDEGESRQD